MGNCLIMAFAQSYGQDMKETNFAVVRFKDRVLIPTISRTTDGHSLQANPVLIFDLLDEAGMVRAMVAAIAAEHPVVPTPATRDAWPKPVLLAAAGVRSEAALEKSGASWSAYYRGSLWTIYPSKWNAKGRWELDQARVEKLPGETPPEALARRIVELVKNVNIPQ